MANIFECYLKHFKNMSMAWLPETRYKYGEIVTYDGGLYVCIADSSRNSKPIDFMEWKLINKR